MTLARDNFQIQTYCAAMLEKNPGLVNVTGHIVATRQGIMDWHEWDQSLLQDVRARIERLYDTIANPFLPPSPHADTCSLCKWAATCPALQRGALTVAAGLGLPTPAVFSPESIVSVEDRAKAHSVATALEKWSELVKKQNTEFVAHGGVIPGYRLIDSSSGVSVPKENTLTALDRIASAGFASQEEMACALKLSINDLAKAMTEVRGTSERAEKQRLIEILEGLTVEGRRRYLMRSKSDPLLGGGIDG